ncbi:MAG TPA: preprotein translocase subunit SecG [Nitriliruptorales bacterium]
MTIVLMSFHVLFSTILVLFILLHRGAGGGLSDMFGGGGGMGGLQGSAVVEKNLDRLTIACAVGFVVTNVLLVMTT